jgi:hypothetical protein
MRSNTRSTRLSLLSFFTLFLTPAGDDLWRERERAGGQLEGKKKKNRNASLNTRAQLVRVVSVF